MNSTWPHALASALALATLANPALAQDFTFDLQAGPLAQTLNAIAGQSARIISLDPGLANGKRAPAVVGRMSAEQAMQRALAGSGLALQNG